MIPLKTYMIEAQKKSAEEWTEPLHGESLTKHLGKAHIRGIVSDEDYVNHVSDPTGLHFPVFKVIHQPAGYKKVRVGNTKGEHFVEYTINRAGTVQKKTVYRREEGIHPGVKWAIHSTWNLEDEKAKGKKK